MGEVFFTSDWHFGHARICELAGRPFSSVQEMNEELVRRHNDCVGPSDVVWVLGDVAMGDITESLALCKRMNGQKYLICGNHDRPWAEYPRSASQSIEDWKRRYMDEGGFKFVISGAAFARHPRNRVPIRVPLGFGRSTVDLWHFPRTGDSQSSERHVDWRPRPGTNWLLHGHTHSPEQVDVPERQIHVGVDAWDFEPVHIDLVMGLMP